MEENIIISNLNDFIFCPRSIYFHNLYLQYDANVYHSTDQLNGKFAHKNIDHKQYSSKKNILQGIDVYSEELGLVGKIDILDLDGNILIERKRKINVLYEGYYLQIYAQYFCLIEMGYLVNKLRFYSLLDNKNFDIDVPGFDEKEKLKKIITKIRDFNLTNPFVPNKSKCLRCIYNNLCDYFDGDDLNDN